MNQQPDGMAVRLSALAKNYGHGRAVRDVDLDIAAGEVVALLVPNGAASRRPSTSALAIMAHYQRDPARA